MVNQAPTPPSVPSTPHSLKNKNKISKNFLSPLYIPNINYTESQNQAAERIKDLPETFTEMNLALVEPRGFGKSTKMMALALWAILNEYKKFAVYISNSFDKAVDLVRPIKFELENNKKLIAVYGSQVSQKWASGEFELSNGAKVLARGRGQNVRGLKHLHYRPDLVICDDIEDDEEVESKEQRKDTQEWLDKQVMKGVDNMTGNVIVVGTVLHPDSLIANIATKKERPEKYKRFIPFVFKALDKNDRSIWEQKFPTEQLLRERQEDPYSFAQERMNEPIPIGSGMFKKEYFKYFTLETDGIHVADKIIPLSHCHLYLTMDLAASEKTHADYTVLLVSALSPDNDLYVLEYTRKRWQDPENAISEMYRLSEKYEFRRIGVETVASQKWFWPILQKSMRKRLNPLSVEELIADKDKVRRISQLQPRFHNGMIFLRNTMTELEEELLLHPKPPNDDISDALAYVLQLMSIPIKQKTAPKGDVFEWWSKRISGYDMAKRQSRYPGKRRMVPIPFTETFR